MANKPIYVIQNPESVKRINKANEQACLWQAKMGLIPHKVQEHGKKTFDVKFKDKNGNIQNRSDSGNRVMSKSKVPHSGKLGSASFKRIVKEIKKVKPTKPKEVVDYITESNQRFQPTQHHLRKDNVNATRKINDDSELWNGKPSTKLAETLSRMGK